MSMTREEAIDLLIHGEWIYSLSTGNKEMQELCEAISIVDAALRPISREQVEKVFPGCEMCSGWNGLKLKPCANGDLGVQADIGSSGDEDTFGLVVYNHLLASGYVDFPFCPFCGKPKTNEAVDMMLERWKEAVDGEAD